VRALRLVALWAVLFAVYAAGIGIDPRSGDELVHLRIAKTLIDDGQVEDLPQGAGFALLIAPARELGGARAVELMLAAIAALGFVLAALLARRIVPEPYASAGAALAGLSPPATAHGAAIYPELLAGTLLAGGALCAASARERPRKSTALGGGAMLAVLPWLSPLLVIPAAPVALALYTWCRRGRRPLLGLVSVELIGGSLVFYATLNERLYGGPTPWSANPPGVTATGAQTAVDYLERLPRLATAWVDPSAGLLRWAPVFALVFYAGWLLWRSQRTGLSRVVSARAGAEATAELALAIVGAQLLVAAFLVPSLETRHFAALHLAPALPVAGALVAWGLRHQPRIGGLLGVITLAASVWVLLR
jgi:hypothetical protein